MTASNVFSEKMRSHCGAVADVRIVECDLFARDRFDAAERFFIRIGKIVDDDPPRSRALLQEQYPFLWPSNAFIGNVLCHSVLAREERKEQLLSEIKDCYLYMADRTGTLWENNEPTASCCHGFASVAAVWLKEIFA